MQATHTPAEPPNRGRRVLAIMGWITNSNAALAATVTPSVNCLNVIGGDPNRILSGLNPSRDLWKRWR
jgi:hypothetical protein